MTAFLGYIKSESGIDRRTWIALISKHLALEHFPSRLGINPFTRKEHEYKVPPTEANIKIDGVEAGSIGWAKDGSPMLIVFAEEEMLDGVISIANDIAAALGSQFVKADESK